MNQDGFKKIEVGKDGKPHASEKKDDIMNFAHESNINTINGSY